MNWPAIAAAGECATETARRACRIALAGKGEAFGILQVALQAGAQLVDPVGEHAAQQHHAIASKRRNVGRVGVETR